MELQHSHIEDLKSGTREPLNGNIELAEQIFTTFDFLNPKEGDIFFETFGIGNHADIISEPLERLANYEDLLAHIQQKDSVKYQKLFKGTPFFFMAWLSFQMKSFEKGIFYMDAAISEDIQKVIHSHRQKNPSESRTNEQLSKDLLPEWIKEESGKFFTLQSELFPSIKVINTHLKDLWNNQLNRFNTETSSNLTIEHFINKFILKLAEDVKSRSIVTALYSFIMEYEDVRKLILLRSYSGGSIEPILTFLFKGALIFESLLKYKYPTMDNLKPVTVISNVTGVLTFRTKYGISSIQSGANSLATIVTGCSGTSDIPAAFNTTAKIRNTSGHNLSWDDIFNSISNFDMLFQQIINSILFICREDFQ